MFTITPNYRPAAVPGSITYVTEEELAERHAYVEPVDSPTNIVGAYFLGKYRQRAAEVGVPAVARQLKKQGVAPEIAVLILAVRP